MRIAGWLQHTSSQPGSHRWVILNVQIRTSPWTQFPLVSTDSYLCLWALAHAGISTIRMKARVKWGTENKLGGEQRGSVVLVASVHWRSDRLPLKAPVCFMHQPSATAQVYILGALSSFMERAATVLQKESLTCWCQEPPFLPLCNN